MIRGIDVSDLDSPLDEVNLPADIAFVAIKAAEGATEHDPDFEENYHYLRDNKPEVVRIPYLFFKFQDDGIAQAKNVLNIGINFTEKGTGPLMIDLEPNDGVTDQWMADNRELIIKRITDCVNYVMANGCSKVIIYSFDSFIKETLNFIWPQTIFWVSSFQSTPPPLIPNWPYKLWQYSQYGQLNGAVTGGSMDLDQWMGTQEELNAIANM